MRVATIAIHTFKESVREKVLYNLVAFALLLIGASILFGSISVGVERIILITLGLTSISVFGLLIAIFIGIGLVSKEIERQYDLQHPFQAGLPRGIHSREIPGTSAHPLCEHGDHDRRLLWGFVLSEAFAGA